MLKEKFKEIAIELGCEYEYSEQYIKSLGGSNIPISYHNYLINYKSKTIRLNYEFGNHNLGTIEFQSKNKRNIPDFEITTKSHLSRLFSRNKIPFKIACIDKQIKSKLAKALDNSGYTDIVKEVAFEPNIKGENTSGKYEINTHFYLGFDNKEDAIIPSVKLYKYLINELIGESH